MRTRDSAPEHELLPEDGRPVSSSSVTVNPAVRIATLVARICSILTALFGVTSLCGWFFGVAVLTSFGTDLVPMAPSTALLFVVVGASIFVSARATHGRVFRLLTPTAVLVGALSAVLLVVSLRSDYSVAAHIAPGANLLILREHIAHVAPIDALGFLLIAVSVGVRASRRREHRSASVAVTAAETCLGALVIAGLAGYALGSPILYNSSLLPTAFPTVLGFMFATIALVAIAIGARISTRRDDKLQPSGRVRHVLLGFLVAATVVIAGLVVARSLSRYFRAEAAHDLAVIADLKTREVVQWRAERRADAEVMAKTPQFARTVSTFLANGEPETDHGIVSWLETIRTGYGYARLSIYSPDGTLRLGVPDLPSPGRPMLGTFFAAVGEEAEFVDLNRTDDGMVVMTIVVPIRNTQSSDALVGVATIDVDPERFLYPTIQRWPVDSDSGETLIVRRSGDQVEFLNDLRFQRSAALSLSRPLSETSLPAARAVNGYQGVVEGTDYRGVDVVAYVRAIPDSPWYLVAKLDAAEFYLPLRRLYYGFLAFLGIVLLCVVGIGAALWQTRSRRHISALLEVETARGAAETRLRITLQSIGDAVITTDARGIVRLVNPVAERLTGWTQSDAVGRNVDEVFRIAREDDQTPVESPVRRVLSEGVVVGLANHTLLLARDGRQTPIADSGAPIRASDGEIQGVVLVFRDQTEERLAQNALREREQYLSRLFEHMSDGFALHDIILDEEGKPVDYRFVEINKAFATITGIDESAVGKTVREILPGIEVDPEDWIGRYGRVAATGVSDRFEAYAEALRRWYSVTAYCPEPGRFATVFQDISRRKQTELEIDNQRALLNFRAQMLDNIGEAVVVTDPEGTVLFWNRAATRLYGWTADEAVFAPLDRLAAIHESGAASLEDLRRDEDGSGWSGETRMPRRNGTTFPALVTTTPVRDDTGTLTAIIGVARDISERKSAELRYAGLFDSIWDAIFLATADGEITDSNRGFSQLFGYQQDEMPGRWTADLCADADSAQEFSAAVEDAGHGPGTRRVVEYRKRTGESFRGETVVYNLIDDTATSGYVAIIRDVSEHEAMEAKLIEAQKIEALGQIAGGIAHDFNNVLTAISAATRVLSGRVLDTAGKRYLGVIRSSVQRGNGVTSRMLTFARSTTPEARSIALASFLADFQELARHSLPSNVHVGLGVVSDEQCVRVDPTQLQQVLLTLAINAADAMPNGGEIVIAVRAPTAEEQASFATPDGESTEHWCVDVIDQGVGIDQETKARVFEPFFTTKATVGGTGLGLAVARKIVQLHRGWISVESEPGRGTTVTVALPAAPAGEVTHGVDEPIVPGNGERLLIVDDEEAVREMLVEILADNEYVVVPAANATEALGLLGDESNRFDLVVTDIGLPDINGQELIGRVRADFANLPIVAVTGYVDSALIESLTRIGASAVIRKPYDVGELTKVIHAILTREPD